jgi:predicted RNase H-like HicB family nuclease
MGNPGSAPYVPDLPGVVSVGDSEDEVKANIQGAIELHLEGLRERLDNRSLSREAP